MTPQFGLVWSCSGQDLAVKAPEHSNEYPGCVKSWEFTECWATIIFSRVHSCYIDLISENQKFIITKIPTIWMFIWVNPN
jgi:hypothetical protein